MTKQSKNLSDEIKDLRGKVNRIDSEVQALRVAAAYQKKNEAPDTLISSQDEGSSTAPPAKTPITGESQWPSLLWMKRNWGKVLSGAVALAVALINYLQWDDAHRHFELEQRSWLKISYEYPDPAKPLSLNSVKVTFTNIGKSTVTKFYGHGLAQVLPVAAAPSLSLAIPHSRDYLNVISPGEPTEWHIPFGISADGSPIDITKEQLDGLREGRLYIAVYGIVEYRDQFGSHWYRFCEFKPYQESVTNIHAGECIQFNIIGDGLAQFNW